MLTISDREGCKVGQWKIRDKEELKVKEESRKLLQKGELQTKLVN